jgi:hypothetical protein
MKDLYRKLGIEPDASATEIQAALEQNPEISDFAAILLDEHKREGYDEAHAALRAIGVMRHKLGLDTGDTWFVESYPDFAPRLFLHRTSTFPHKSEATVQAADKNYELEPYHRPKHRRPGRSNTPVVVTVVVVAIVLAILAFKYF